MVEDLTGFLLQDILTFSYAFDPILKFLIQVWNLLWNGTKIWAPSLTSMVCRKNVHPRVWRNNIQLVCSTNDHDIFEKSADLRVWWTSIHGKNWDRIASILWCHNVHLVWRTSIHVSKVWRISNHHYEGIKSGRQWYLLYMKWPDYCTIFLVIGGICLRNSLCWIIVHT